MKRKVDPKLPTTPVLKLSGRCEDCGVVTDVVSDRWLEIRAPDGGERRIPEGASYKTEVVSGTTLKQATQDGAVDEVQAFVCHSCSAVLERRRLWKVRRYSLISTIVIWSSFGVFVAIGYDIAYQLLLLLLLLSVGWTIHAILLRKGNPWRMAKECPACGGSLFLPLSFYLDRRRKCPSCGGWHFLFTVAERREAE